MTEDTSAGSASPSRTPALPPKLPGEGFRKWKKRLDSDQLERLEAITSRSGLCTAPYFFERYVPVATDQQQQDMHSTADR